MMQSGLPAHSRGGLGRGLGALIPNVGAGIQEIPVDRIVPSSVQPRHRFDADELADLSASIKAHGVLQPVVVARGEDGNYALIAGERRWRAAQMAGMSTVPALVKDASAREALELALVENLQRADLTPLEEAGAYRQLVDGYQLTQEQVASRVGRSRAAVTNRLRLLSLPVGAMRLLAEGAISEGHARALLGSPDPSIVDMLAERVAAKGLSVRETEELVRRSAADGNPARGRAASTAERDSALRDVEERLQRALGTRVQVLRSRRGGRVVVHFYDDGQLEGLLELLLGEDAP